MIEIDPELKHIWVGLLYRIALFFNWNWLGKQALRKKTIYKIGWCDEDYENWKEEGWK